MSATMDWAAHGGSGPERYQAFLVAALFAPFAERLVALAGIEPGARVLDVACGTGAVARAAARKAGPDGRVTGVDLGPPMLEVARAQPAEHGAAPIEYLEGSAESLPVADRGFDVVTCQQGLQFFPDRPAALNAMRAALDSAGRLAVATWGPETNPAWGALAEALARHIGEEAGAMMRSPFGLTDPDELRRLLQGAGFADVDVSQDTLTVDYGDRSEFARCAVMAGPVAPAFAAASPQQQQRVAADVANAVASHVGSDEILRVPMTTNVGLARA